MIEGMNDAGLLASFFTLIAKVKLLYPRNGRPVAFYRIRKPVIREEVQPSGSGLTPFNGDVVETCAQASSGSF